MRIDARIWLAFTAGMLAGWALSHSRLSVRIQKLDSEMHVLEAAVRPLLAAQQTDVRLQPSPPYTTDPGRAESSNGLPVVDPRTRPVQILDFDSAPDQAPGIMTADPLAVISDD